MIIQGNNVIISHGDIPLAASKSCTINTNADTIETSSPLQDKWRTYIPSMKSWSLTTNHLVVSNSVIDGHIGAVSSTSSDDMKTRCKVPSVYGSDFVLASQGFNVFAIKRDNEKGYIVDTTPKKVADDPKRSSMYFFRFQIYSTYDLIASSTRSDLATAMIAKLKEISDAGNIIGIITMGPWMLTKEVADAIKTYTNVDLSSLQTETEYNRAMVIFGKQDWKDNKGNAAGILKMSLGESPAETVSVDINMKEGAPVTETKLKDFLEKAGEDLKLTCEVKGFPFDKVSGNAICTSAKITATRGNLLQGSFSWKGNGPLE